ncbi:MAG: Gmad2 immunoglobulin-like domain-containing protein [bacterium]|nr:Gmad2 immunoglobulin-like domain-containing protein [bacterium]
MKPKTFIIALIVVIIGTVGVYLLVERPSCIFGPSEKETVDSFEECVAAGYPVMESYPRQCRIPDGENFIEDIGNILEKEDLIRVDTPRPNDTISSPLIIEGEARGYWFFEADFPIKLLDGNGDLVVLAIAHAKSEWMTEDFVPFEAVLEFEVTDAEKGTLVLEKDNPSGLPENADELRIPVKFETAKRTVELYYYNPELDRDGAGNILCSREGLVRVQREIPVSQTPIQNTIRLLLRGELTQEEREKGITTEYPLEEFSLKGASLKGSVLTLEFEDPNNRSVGGSCRVGILWFQIEATAKQFTEAKEVRFLPEEIFQP